MNGFFSFIRMKYEQYMMRKLDRLLNRFEKNERLRWYPDFIMHEKYSDSLLTKYL